MSAKAGPAQTIRSCGVCIETPQRTRSPQFLLRQDPQQVEELKTTTYEEHGPGCFQTVRFAMVAVFGMGRSPLLISFQTRLDMGIERKNRDPEISRAPTQDTWSAPTCRPPLANKRSIHGGPKKPHEQKDPLNQGFWNPLCLGPWKQNLGSLCLCGL